MSMVCGLDLHRGQITFDALQVESGEVWRGRVGQPDRARFRRWLTNELAPRAKDGPVEVVVEGCTGWRYVVEEITAAGFDAHVAEPADTQAARGRKKRAKTDRSDAKLLRELLAERGPARVVDPARGVLEWRERVRLYKTLLDQRRMWIQRIHAELFQHGVSLPEAQIDSRRTRDWLTGDAVSADRSRPSARRGRLPHHRYHRRHAPAIASRDRTLRSTPARMQSLGCCSLRDRPADSVVVWAELGTVAGSPAPCK